jgi:hypothetical protein
LDDVASSTLIVNDCKGEVVSHKGVVYYANGTEIRKLVAAQGQATGAGNEIPAPVAS